MSGATTLWQQTYAALRTGAAIQSLLDEVRGAGAFTPSAEAVTLGVARAELLAALKDGHTLISRQIADERRTLAALAELYDDVRGGGS